VNNKFRYEWLDRFKESQTYRGTNAMKHLAIFLIAIVISLTLLSGQVYAADKHFEYEQCVLENLQEVTHDQDWTTIEIKRICKENHTDFSRPSKKKQKYNQCLLNYLFGVESRLAANEIIKICRHRHL